jgi:hypothetical protein
VKEKFQDINFSAPARAIIDRAATTIDGYMAKGYNLSLRQLYYQYIGHDWFPDTWVDAEYNLKHKLPADTKNTQKNYKRLGDIIGNARMAGLIDWDAITDRHRSTEQRGTYPDLATYLQAVNEQYRRDKWVDQDTYVEVMVEKDALAGILGPVCERWEVAFTANKGYSSLTSMYERGKKLQSMRDVEGKEVHVIYLSDHDASGRDMVRDITRRLTLFSDGLVNVHNIALTIDQVHQYQLPENPLKTGDSRAEEYLANFGEHTWELDAFPPEEMVALVEGKIRELVSIPRWNRGNELQQADRDQLQDIIEGLPT